MINVMHPILSTQHVLSRSTAEWFVNPVVCKDTAHSVHGSVSAAKMF